MLAATAADLYLLAEAEVGVTHVVLGVLETLHHTHAHTHTLSSICTKDSVSRKSRWPGLVIVQLDPIEKFNLVSPCKDPCLMLKVLNYKKGTKCKDESLPKELMEG